MYTYKHLLSPKTATVQNPFRTIALCDIDAAYAQFEAKRINADPEAPLIVIQWETIIAVNYPARKYGITRCSRMKSHDAVALCPHLIVAHVATYRPGDSEAGYWGDEDVRYHKVSLDPYRKESDKILAIYAEFIGEADLEKASIDEAFLDLSNLVRKRIFERFPYLREPPPDAPKGLDTPLPPPPPVDWSGAGTVIPTFEETRPTAEWEDSDEEEGERYSPREEPKSDTWRDWAICIGGEIMHEIRAEVRKRLGYTCSAGVAHNKTLAKLSAGRVKPNGQCVLRERAVTSFLTTFDFQKIRNLGGKLGREIAERYGVTLIPDLLKVPLKDLQRDFGEEALWVYNVIRGIDHTPITPRILLNSMLASKNAVPQITTPEDGQRYVHLLSGELAARLTEFRQTSPGLWPRTLSMSHRTGYDYANPAGNVKSRQLPFKYKADFDANHIAKLGLRLWEGVCREYEETGFTFSNLSMQFMELERVEVGQRRIADFLAASLPKAEQIDRDAIDQSPVKIEIAVKRSRDEHIVKEEDAGENAKVGFDDDIDPQDPFWTCHRCNKEFSGGLNLDPDERYISILDTKRDHQDYHFAMDLQNDAPIVPSGTPEIKKERKRRKVKGGIASYFQAKSG